MMSSFVRNNGKASSIPACTYVRMHAELKREIAIWERTAVRLPVVSLEERAVRDALLAKAGDVRQQLQQQVNITYVP